MRPTPVGNRVKSIEGFAKMRVLRAKSLAEANAKGKKHYKYQIWVLKMGLRMIEDVSKTQNTNRDTDTHT